MQLSLRSPAPTAVEEPCVITLDPEEVSVPSRQSSWHRKSPVPVYSSPHVLRTNTQYRIPPLRPATYKRRSELDCVDTHISPEPSRTHLFCESSSQMLMTPLSRTPASTCISPTYRSRSRATCSPSPTPSIFTYGSRCSSSPQRERSCWSPERCARMPATLWFDSWWQEKGHQILAVISYDTESQICTASLHVELGSRVRQRFGQTSVEPWDLHVGAKIRLLGRTLTLRRARDTATVEWLDQQATLLQRQILKLEAALTKYRGVAHVQSSCAGRYQWVDHRTHQPTTKGGTTNLRALRTTMFHLAKALRQFQPTLPPLSPQTHTKQGEVDSLSVTVDVGAPPDWAPERHHAEAEMARLARATRAQREAELAALEAAKDTRKDVFDFLSRIPLAASAARLEKKGDKYIDPSLEVPAKQETLEVVDRRKSEVRRRSALMLDMGVVDNIMMSNSGAMPSLQPAQSVSNLTTALSTKSAITTRLVPNHSVALNSALSYPSAMHTDGGPPVRRNRASFVSVQDPSVPLPSHIPSHMSHISQALLDAYQSNTESINADRAQQRASGSGDGSEDGGGLPENRVVSIRPQSFVLSQDMIAELQERDEDRYTEDSASQPQDDDAAATRQDTNYTWESQMTDGARVEGSSAQDAADAWEPDTDGDQANGDATTGSPPGDTEVAQGGESNAYDDTDASEDTKEAHGEA